jgi:phospholipid transport system substrate-binding protein
MMSGVARAEIPATAEAAAATIGALRDQGTAMLNDPGLGPEERVLAFRRLFTSSFAVGAISRFVLGRHWRRASAAERVEYRALFEDYIIATYARRLDDYGGEVLVLGAARLERPGLALVSSQVVRAQGASVAVDWRLRHGEDGWRIVDIVVEGISLAVAQRATFAAVIRTNGGRVDGLLAKLRQAIQQDRSRASSRVASAR